MLSWLRKAAWGFLLWAVLNIGLGVTYPPLRQALGPYVMVTYKFQFAAADDDAAMGDTGVGSTVLAYEMPWAGWVAAYSHNSVGNLTAGVFLVHLAGSPVAALTWTVNGATTSYGEFARTAGQFSAGDALGVEVDSVTTMDETTITLYVVHDISAVEV